MGKQTDPELGRRIADALTGVSSLIHNLSEIESASDKEIANHRFKRWRDRARNFLAANISLDEARRFVNLPEDLTLHIGCDQRRKFLESLKDDIMRHPVEIIGPDPLESEENELHVKKTQRGNRVFLIHGHGQMEDTVASYVEQLGLEPVILREQPDRSQTVIEKFEKHSDVAFAIAILTEDDEGRRRGEDKLHPRARQNVIFELGYFAGKLGRSHVVALCAKRVEIPSDWSGVIYIPIDANEGWKLRLAKDLAAAGFEVDAHKMISA